MAARIKRFGEPLTSTESEVLDLLSTGMLNKEIAWVLNLSYGTVKVYVTWIMRKTGTRNRTELAMMARRAA